MDSRNRIRRFERWSIIRDRGQVCAYCGVRGGHDGARGEPWQIDHIVPVGRGGAAHDPANLALVCWLCNIVKGSHLLAELPEHLARLRSSSRHPEHIDLMIARLADANA